MNVDIQCNANKWWIDPDNLMTLNNNAYGYRVSQLLVYFILVYYYNSLFHRNSEQS